MRCMVRVEQRWTGVEQLVVGVLYLGVNDEGTPSLRITNPDKTQRRVMDYLQEPYPPIPGMRAIL
jgi:hypothetical protein